MAPQVRTHPGTRPTVTKGGALPPRAHERRGAPTAARALVHHGPRHSTRKQAQAVGAALLKGVGTWRGASPPALTAIRPPSEIMSSRKSGRRILHSPGLIGTRIASESLGGVGWG